MFNFLIHMLGKARSLYLPVVTAQFHNTIRLTDRSLHLAFNHADLQHTHLEIIRLFASIHKKM